MIDRKPNLITFTGVDEGADYQRMIRLSHRYPIEWGILLSPGRQGKEPRYPSERNVEVISSWGLRYAAHLCGQHARDVIDFQEPKLDLTPFDRIQINIVMPDKRDAVPAAQRFSQRIGKRCILQARGWRFPDGHEVDWLQDNSGGRGAEMVGVFSHGCSRFVGHSGGIGPDNVSEVVRRINEHNGNWINPYWLDMESGVRTDDRFDLDKVEAVCQAVYGERHDR